VWEDPIVAEVWRVRMRLAERFEFDLHAAFADLRKRQSILGSRLVRRQKRLPIEKGAAPAEDSGLRHPGR